MSGLGWGFGALSTAASSVTAAVSDETTKRQLASVTSSVASTAGSWWGGLSAGATNLVNDVTAPEDPGGDGLADLQRQFHSQRSANPDGKYGGFGSDNVAAPEDPGGDGLADLQRQFHSRRSADPDSKYAGFGSDNLTYLDAYDFCGQQEGGRICPYDAVCPMGPNT